MHAPMPAQPDPTGHHLGVGMNLFLGKKKMTKQKKNVSDKKKNKA